METINSKTLLDALQGKLTELAAGLQPYMGNGGVQACGQFAAHPLARELGFTKIDAAAMGLYPEEWLNLEWSRRKIQPHIYLKVAPHHYQQVYSRLVSLADKETTNFWDTDRVDTFEFKLRDMDVCLEVGIAPNIYWRDEWGQHPAEPNDLALHIAQQYYSIMLCYRDSMPLYDVNKDTGASDRWPEELRGTKLPVMFPETRGYPIWVEQWVQAMSHVSGIPLGEMEELYKELMKKILNEDAFLARLTANGATLSPGLKSWLCDMSSLRRKCHFAYGPGKGR